MTTMAVRESSTTWRSTHASRRAETFLDVLFGVLLGYMLSAVPVEAILHAALLRSALFLLIFLTLVGKLFDHWLALSRDLVLYGKYLRETARATDYLLSLLVGFCYVVLAKLLFVWLSAEDPRRALITFALAASMFRIGDFAFNAVGLPRRYRAAAARQPGNVPEALEHWCLQGLPRGISAYLLHVPLVLMLVFLPSWGAVTYPFGFVVVEILTDWLLFRGRRRLMSSLQGADQHVASADHRVVRAKAEDSPRPETRDALARGLFVFAMAVTLAYLEIQIEGAAGWASSLPTWRSTSKAITWLFAGRPVTGYHVALNVLLLLLFHWPFAFTRWTWVKEARTLQCFAVLAVVWDFLWFVMNPAFGLERYGPNSVWWFHHWFLGLPIDYYVGIAAALLIGCLPVFLAQKPLRQSLYESVVMISGPVVLAAVLAIAWGVVI